MGEWSFLPLLVLPGVLACLISIQFDEQGFRYNKLKVLISYFVYSFAIIFLTTKLSILMEIIPFSTEISNYIILINQFSSAQFTEFVLLTVLVSIIIGGGVPFLLKYWIKTDKKRSCLKKLI